MSILELKTKEDKSAESADDVTDCNENSSLDNKSSKTVVSTKELNSDASWFKPPGINFNAKLIGVEEVDSSCGDKMCQNSIAKLKMAVKQSGQHKPRIIINISLEGIKVLDQRTQAEPLVLTLRNLFEVVYKIKKQEVENAQIKIKEPSNEAGQGETKHEESMDQIPDIKPVENSTDQSDQVPTYSQPVASEAADLLCLETELETIERHIEQIDTMEELYKELETPPMTKSSSSWAFELGSLSNGAQSQNQSLFSLGGSPFSTSQVVPPFSGPQIPFGAQPFGVPTPATAGSYEVQQQFAPPANPFQVPAVPARTSMGFPGQPNPYFATPFPGSQPFVPRSPHFAADVPAYQPLVTPTPINDPFGSDPFASGNSAFEESILKPAKLEPASSMPETEVQKSKDFFGDLVNIGAKTKVSKSPKDLFTDLSTPDKKPLNQMKVEKNAASPKPSSPFGFQDNDPFGMPPSFN